MRSGGVFCEGRRRTGCARADFILAIHSANTFSSQQNISTIGEQHLAVTKLAIRPEPAAAVSSFVAVESFIAAA